MEISATQKFIHHTPRKMRLVADSIRGKKPAEALVALGFMTKRAAPVIAKAIKSALANATNNAKLPVENMKIKSIQVSEGPRLKRFRPVSRGMAHGYVKRMSHITVVLEGEA